MFEGMNPRWWVRRCERFFQFYKVPKEQKVNLVATYLNDAVDSWFQRWIIQDEGNDGQWGNLQRACVNNLGRGVW